MQPAPELRPSVELEEITASRLQIMNLLKPVLAGKPMTVESFDSIMREVTGDKRRVALEVLRQLTPHCSSREQHWGQPCSYTFQAYCHQRLGFLFGSRRRDH